MLDFMVHKSFVDADDSPKNGSSSRIILLESGASDKGRFLHRFVASLRKTNPEFGEHCWFQPNRDKGCYCIDDAGVKILYECVPRPIIGRCRQNAIARNYKSFSQYV